MLGFLDLDMAYSADTFLTVRTATASCHEEQEQEQQEHEHEPGVTVGISEEDFNVIMWKEYVNLMEVLAGSDASSGVPQVARATIDQHSTPATQGVKSALHDTLILAYMDAYNDRQHAYSGEVYDADLHAAAYSVMKLAVIVMAPFVA